MASERHKKIAMSFQSVLLAALAVISMSVPLSSCSSTLPASQENTQDPGAAAASENTQASAPGSAEPTASGIPDVQGADSV